MTVTQYVERVRAALADLPPQVRDELLSELPEHLAEVAAESDEPLEARLGPPEAYAAELRQAADLAPPSVRPAQVRFAALLTEVRGRLRMVDADAGRLLGYETGTAFARQLRPGWWVLRGYLSAMLVAYLVNPDRGSIGLLPRLGLFSPQLAAVAALVLLVGAVVASVWLGRRTERLSRVPRLVLAAGAALLVFAAMLGFATADRAKRGPYVYTEYVNHDPYRNIQDVYVYDRDGRLLRDVTLVDQYGKPIVLGEPGVPCGEPAVAEQIRYPRCPKAAPPTRYGLPTATPVAPTMSADTPTASPAGMPAEMPTASPADMSTATVSPSPSPSPSPVSGTG